MKKCIVVTVAFLIGACAGARGGERPRFPDVQRVLSQHNFASIAHFRQWRRDMIDTIRTTVEHRASKDNDQAQGNETHICMVWAGELRATELTPLLIKHIDFKVLCKEDLAYEDLYPAIRALILIGTDATAACVGALSSETDPLRRKNLALIIRACPR